jgi:predicted PurR-regulated permease PerM
VAGPGPPTETARKPVPVRTILAAIGLVLATVLLLLLIRDIQRVLIWIIIAGFFAVAVYPVVNWIERRLPWCRRSLATLVVFLLLVLLTAGVITLFAVPLARQATSLAHQLPVKLNPLTVLIAILVAVELAGLLGALLAIPIAAMIQIILRDLWARHRGRLKPEPTARESPTHAAQASNAGPAPPRP